MELMRARTRSGNGRTPGRVKLALAAALSLALGGCLGYDGQVVHGYQLDPKSAEQVKAGASAEQILVTFRDADDNIHRRWRRLVLCYQVTNRDVSSCSQSSPISGFSRSISTKDKKVERVANYGMEDGKLFDFVSRTTPTAGAESTFLKGMFVNLFISSPAAGGIATGAGPLSARPRPCHDARG